MLELYYAPGTISLASMIALNDAGAAHRLHRVDFRTEEQKGAAYTAVNPKARVPALVTAEGPLTETPAILAYIAQTHPQAGLAPAEPFAFARMQAFNCYLCATLHVAHAHRMRGHRWSDDPAAWEAMRRFVPQSVGACWEYVETHALAGPWVMGEHYTVADPYLFTVAQWMEADSIDPARFPRVADHRTRMAERGNVREALSAMAA